MTRINKLVGNADNVEGLEERKSRGFARATLKLRAAPQQ